MTQEYKATFPVVDQNENYICEVDADYKDKDGVEIPYKIVNKQYGVVEARIDSLSQAYIYLYQMNALLVGDKWKELVGAPADSDIPDNILNLFNPSDTAE